MGTCICDECNKVWKEEEVEPLSSRTLNSFLPDDIIPAGNCPDCGGLVFVESRWIPVSLIDKILKNKKLVPLLMGIDPELDKLIEKRIKK